MNNQPNSRYTKVIVYGALSMYIVLTTAWPWLWPDAYYHATVTYIYLLSLINVELVIIRNRPYDKWLLRGVCMSCGIAFIEVIDEVNKTVDLFNSNPEQFRFWEYWATGFVVCVCLIGATKIKAVYEWVKKQGIKVTKHIMRNILTTWNRITTAWKD